MYEGSSNLLIAQTKSAVGLHKIMTNKPHFYYALDYFL
ncbi:hypothetical protein HMPREF1052_0116 [Pasteurella bettyae CCUG 2042]|uniref:Uncharacterized protein n=1 Tax=Pasteurella bettyae CCUG 2042 TaxID=1095749 RepID=I3DI39_9PAST|nr:hypothetical protein HMPREF1052_0116 [Pasteurella bettyae CCUG 2042]